MRLCLGISTGALHCEHKRRAKRCAMTRLTEVAILNEGTPYYANELKFQVHCWCVVLT